MPIPVDCPGCGKSFFLTDAHAGKKGRCNECATVFRVPALAVRSSSASPPVDPFADLHDVSSAAFPPRVGRARDPEFDPSPAPKRARRARRRRPERDETDPLYSKACQVLGTIFLIRLALVIAVAISMSQSGTSFIPLDVLGMLDIVLGIGWLGGLGMLLFAQPVTIMQRVTKYFLIGIFALGLLAIFVAKKPFEPNKPPAPAAAPLPPPIRMPMNPIDNPNPAPLPPAAPNPADALGQKRAEQQKRMQEKQAEFMRKSQEIQRQNQERLRKSRPGGPRFPGQ